MENGHFKLICMTMSFRLMRALAIPVFFNKSRGEARLFSPPLSSSHLFLRSTRLFSPSQLLPTLLTSCYRARFYTEKLLHKASFYTRQAFAQRSFFTKQVFSQRSFFTRQAFAQRSFFTGQPFSQKKNQRDAAAQDAPQSRKSRAKAPYATFMQPQPCDL